MKPKELLPQQAITATGLMPSLELVEIIQRLVKIAIDQENRIAALEESMANINTIDDIDGGNP